MNEVSKAKTKIVMSASCCGWLMYHGFHLVDMRDDFKDTRRKVYVFNDTEKLSKCIDDFHINKTSKKYY